MGGGLGKRVNRQRLWPSCSPEFNGIAMARMWTIGGYVWIKMVFRGMVTVRVSIGVMVRLT